MKIFAVIFLSLFSTFIFAQVSDNPNDLEAKIFRLTVKTIAPGSLKLPFQSILIIDSRPDTSKLGFRPGRKFLKSNYMFEKILLGQGNQKGIQNFYNEYYNRNFTPNGKVLLISMKKLWINNITYRQGEIERDIDRLSEQDIHAKFEYYLGSGNVYSPIKRIDTVFDLTHDRKVEDYDAKDENKLPFFCFALEKMIENVNFNFYMNDLDKRKKMSMEEIQKYNATAKDIPILNEPIKKGVFLTFNEFKNNQPSITSFSKRKIPNKKIYEVVDDKDNVILDYFAYYDGEKLAAAKHLADLFSKPGLFSKNISQDNYGMYRINDTFQFFENYFQYAGRESNTPGSDQNTRSLILVGVPRQLDMETGAIY